MAIVNKQPPIIGLIGAIGGGKSTVAQELARLGAAVIDADKVGHEVLARPEVKAKVVNEFGAEVLNLSGAVDRRILGKVVFSDPEKRKRLEAIVHPLIRSEVEAQIDKLRSAGSVPLIVLEAALLLEAGWNDVCDQVVFVDAPHRARLERLARSRGWSAEELARREQAQLPLSQKRKSAHVVFENNADHIELTAKVRQLFDERTRLPVHPRQM